MSIANVVKATVTLVGIAAVGYVGYVGYKGYQKHVGPIMKFRQALTIIEVKLNKLDRAVAAEKDAVLKAEKLEKLKLFQAKLIEVQNVWSDIVGRYASDELTHEQWVSEVTQWHANVTSTFADL